MIALRLKLITGALELDPFVEAKDFKSLLILIEVFLFSSFKLTCNSSIFSSAISNIDLDFGRFPLFKKLAIRSANTSA